MTLNIIICLSYKVNLKVMKKAVKPPVLVQQVKKVCMHVFCAVIMSVATVFLDFDYQRQFAIIEFEKPVYCAEKSLVIGSRLDTDAYILHLCLCVLYYILRWMLGTCTCMYVCMYIIFISHSNN